MSSLPPDDFEFRQWLAARLRPLETTQPGHDLYAPLHEGTPHDPVTRILRDIRLNETGDSLNLISGFSGSGKSSELRRLQTILDADRFDAFIVDADDYFMATEAVDIEVLLIKLAAAWCDALDSSHGITQGQPGYARRFWDWLNRTEVKIEGLEAGYGANKLKIVLKDNPSVLQRVQEARTKRPGVILEALRQLFQEITSALREKSTSARSPVLMLDTLEKRSDTPSTKGSVAESFRTLLTAHMGDLAIPGLHLVLTMPPWIKLAGLGQDRVRMIYGVKLWQNTRDRKAWPDGYARMRAIVQRRFQDEGLQRFFGDASPNGSRPLVDALIHASGGHVRDLITLLYELLLDAPDGAPPAGNAIISEDNVRRVIAAHRSNFSRLSAEAAKCLAEIARTRRCFFPDHGTEAILTLTRLFNSHHAFPLPNEDEWCDVHPLALEAVDALVKRPRKKAATASKKAQAKKTTYRRAKR
ncbi:MAG: hypothetical protein IPK22_28730 [Verrucomicrobiaceae bacterium]|nr:hypothetical protein [Verrucomicrobiaceae bacterium]